MKKNYIFFVIIIFLLHDFLSVSAQCGSNFLINPGFDSPAMSFIGNNITGSFSFNGWTMTGNVFNIVKTDGSAYPSGPDNAKDGNQYADITAAGGTIYQDFTISGPPIPIVFGGYFSSRENVKYINWTASIQIYQLPSNTLMATSTTRSFTGIDGDNPTQETWYYLNGSVTLNNGNYRFLVTMGDFGNFDAALVKTDCIVPIRLRFFEGKQIDNTISLNWKTEDETNLLGFEVEKSTDGVHFFSIGKISLSGDHMYNFVDHQITSGSFTYYRIRIIDVEGKISYSPIRKFNINKALRFKIAPNPVAGILNISGMKNYGRIKVIDLSGKTIFERDIRSESISTNCSFLQRGVYLLEYIDNEQAQVLKFFKQ